MTLLGLVNRVLIALRSPFVIAHDTRGDDRVHPLRLWTGTHMRGSWFIARVTHRDPDGFVHWERR
jgi:hypothetical protein